MRKNRKRRWLTVIGLLCIAAMFLSPSAWVVICSLQPDLRGGVPESILSSWGLSHYRALANDGLFAALRNSLVVAVVSSLSATATACLLAFGLLCRQRPSVRSLLMLVSARLLPAVLFLLPQYIMIRQMGLIETRSGLALVHLFMNLSIALILLSPFVLRTHGRFAEQARLDHARGAFYFYRVMLPSIARPLWFCVCITFMLSWAEYMYAGLFTIGTDVRTVPVLVGNYLTSYSTLWGPMYASVAIAMSASIIIAVVTTLPLWWGARSSART